MRSRAITLGLILLVLVAAIAMWLIGLAGSAKAACGPYPVGPNSPTGIVGCEIYGDGIASAWQGPGVARNDCIYPWTACTPIKITSLDTGRSITVTPTMFCDCYTGTPDERLVDLDPEAIRALGLDPSRGLFPVRVEQAAAELEPPPALPDTAMR